MLKEALEVVIGFLMISCILFFLYLILSAKYEERAQELQCQVNCEPLVSKIISGQCFCKGPGIWMKWSTPTQIPPPKLHGI